jgi:hypothetical protein
MSLGDNNAKPLDVVRLYCKLSPLGLHTFFKSPWCCVRQGDFLKWKTSALKQHHGQSAQGFAAFKAIAGQFQEA